jgi:hypothetical protein
VEYLGMHINTGKSVATLPQQSVNPLTPTLPSAAPPQQQPVIL